MVTDDNPRSEDPASIRAQVLAGARAAGGAAVVVEVGDRRAAIEQALTFVSGPDDSVLVAGKGHEDYQIIGSQRRVFSDAAVVLQVLAARARP